MALLSSPFVGGAGRLGVVALAALVALGCSSEDGASDDTTPADTATENDTDEDTTDDTTQATVRVIGTVKAYVPHVAELSPWTFDHYLVGASVCLWDHADLCTTTNDTGGYRLDGVPTSTQIALLVTGDDLPSYALQSVVGVVGRTNDAGLATTATMDAFLAGSGCTSTPAAGTGALWVGMSPGVKATLTPTPSSPLVYGGADGYFDTSLDRVPTDAHPDYSQAVVCGLAPGVYDIDFDGGTSCHMSEGWPVDGHDLRALVVAGHLTVVNWICP